ncbi:nuclear transport factor 2 family protein [Variovorax sp. dw_954]|uniref:nuclear transport factor 2 family protein n=1 Tax=Variovorax sp. dw_954 TaxID=2720078 RepID=UPI001BD51D02|nr:nuclear transport factor 2 family protein [Variovorax sp. dw_954]
MRDITTDLTDRLAIEELIYLYARTSDSRDFGTMRTLFCADACAVVRDAVSAHEQILSGPDAIAEFVAQRHAAEFARGDRRRHLTSNFILDSCDGANAVARSYVCVLQCVAGQPMQLASMGHYEDHCHKVEGRWRFQKRVLTIEGKGQLPAT